jgi:hypothetical protein
MGIRELLKSLLRQRDQLTVELAEEGVAPEREVHAVEERIGEHHERPAETGDSQSG